MMPVARQQRFVCLEEQHPAYDDGHDSGHHGQHGQHNHHNHQYQQQGSNAFCAGKSRILYMMIFMTIIIMTLASVLQRVRASYDVDVDG